ncbi:hypothetical protein ATCC90586_005633 [Pythium insidiosum]|nr:hypothetical protein ATCC90586_005633 [Pythium insidiosum]
MNDVAVVVASLCDAVVKAANTAVSLRALYDDACQSHQLEAALRATTEWSLRSRDRVDANTIAARRQEMERLLASSTKPGQQRRLQDELVLLHETRPDLHPPPHLRISRITEDEKEYRWDAMGRPLQLRRNVLGQRFATVHAPLAYLHRHSATEIFQDMQARVRDHTQVYSIDQCKGF